MAVYTLADEIARKQAAEVPRNYGKKAPVAPVKPLSDEAKTIQSNIQEGLGYDPKTGTTNLTRTTGANTGGTSTNKSLVAPVLGSNVSGFNPNDTVQTQIADLGQQWHAAAGNKTLQDELHNKAIALRGDVGTFDSRTGVHTLTAPGTGTGDYTGAEIQNDIDAQIRAYEQQLEAAGKTAQYGIDTNNQFLTEQLSGLKSAEAVSGDSAQQLQNRRGGFYSGGLDYQMGGIQREYAGARSALNRDIAGRNQLLIEQYGTQANAIADQIKGLQSSAPGIIRDKILEFQMKTADLTGTFQGQKTVDAKGQEYDQMDKDRYYDLDVSKNDLDNAYAQAEMTGVIGPVLGKLYGLPPNTPTQAARESNRNYALDERQVSASIADMNADNARASSGGGSSGGGGSTKLPALTTYANLLQDQFMPYDPVTRTRKITNPDALERAILSSGYSEAQMQQLYDLFGLNLNSGNSSDRPVSGPLPME